MTDEGRLTIDMPDSMIVNNDFDAIQLPKDTPLETVIDFINDLMLSFTDNRKEKWVKYTKRIKVD